MAWAIVVSGLVGLVVLILILRLVGTRVVPGVVGGGGVLGGGLRRRRLKSSRRRWLASPVDLVKVNWLLRSVTFLLFASVVHDSMPIDLLTFGRGVASCFSAAGGGHARLRRGWLARLIHGLALGCLLVWFRSHSVVYNSIYVSFQVDLKATVCLLFENVKSRK